MQNGFEIRLLANFPERYLRIHDKYSSTNFKQRSRQKKCFKYNNFGAFINQLPRGEVVENLTSRMEDC